MNYETILAEKRGRVMLLTLNRPQALNAINAQLTTELIHAAEEADADHGIGAIVLTGSDKAFAAGADVKEMASASFQDMYEANRFAEWDRFTAIRKPIVAAVSGYALGGGCELAMMCDIIIAAESAKFGQPEITLGIIPGIGGTQRLIRAIGKAKAMEMCLTGRLMEAEEAESSGLVSRVVPAEELMNEAMKTAEKIASMSLPSVTMAKEALNRAFETSLSEGVLHERRLFHALFATDDQKEAMQAFREKRSAQFTHR